MEGRLNDDFSALLPVELSAILEEKIRLGQTLNNQLALPCLKKVVGVAKLQKKVRQEIRFLERFLESEERLAELKKEHVQCSNLVHLHSIITQIFKVKNPMAVMQPFHLFRKDGSVSKKVSVDIVCEGGDCWVKVVARNPRALDLNSQGSSQFGQRSIMDQVREYLRCSQQNPRMFRPPQVLFAFANGVTSSLANRIRRKGALVAGDIVDLHDDDQEEGESEDSDEDDSDVSSDDEHDSDCGADDVCCDNEAASDEGTQQQIMRDNYRQHVEEGTLNLDITAMIAYVSALTNGRHQFIFKEKILAEQAAWERQRPVKPFLDQIFQDKQLICCESAMRDFQNIINTLGGPSERERARELLARINVVPDQDSARTKALVFSGKIKDRSRAIFGTGDNLKVVTVTANSGFVRAAEGQGVNLAVIVHESRALTEDKEKRAKPIVAAADDDDMTSVVTVETTEAAAAQLKVCGDFA